MTDAVVGFNLWGGTFEQPVEEVYSLQDSVAVQVVETILGSQSTRASLVHSPAPSSVDAYQASPRTGCDTRPHRPSRFARRLPTPLTTCSVGGGKRRRRCRQRATTVTAQRAASPSSTAVPAAARARRAPGARALCGCSAACGSRAFHVVRTCGYDSHPGGRGSRSAGALVTARHAAAVAFSQLEFRGLSLCVARRMAPDLDRRSVR